MRGIIYYVYVHFLWDFKSQTDKIAAMETPDMKGKHENKGFY